MNNIEHGYMHIGQFLAENGYNLQKVCDCKDEMKDCYNNFTVFKPHKEENQVISSPKTYKR